MLNPHLTSARLVAATVALAIGFFVLDLQLPHGYSGAAPYVIPVLLTFWSRSRSFKLGAAALCTLLLILGWIDSPRDETFQIVGWNRYWAAFVIWSTAVLSVRWTRAEDALAHSEKYFHAAAEHIQSIFSISSADGAKVSYVNRAYETIWGRTIESLYKDPSSWIQAVHPEDHERVRESFVASQVRGGYHEQYRVIRPDGTERWVDARTFPIHDSSGKVQSVAGIVEDITEQKLAEQKLREAYADLEKRVERRTAEMRARVRQQAAVADLGQKALAGCPVDLLLDETARAVTETLDVEFSEVLEWRPERNDFLLRAGVGWGKAQVGVTTVEVEGPSLAAFTLAKGIPVVVANLERESQFSAPKLLRDHGIVSGGSVVISGTNCLYGILGVDSRQERSLSPDDVHFLQSAANVLAAAIDRQRAEQALKKGEARLAHAQAMAHLGNWETDLATSELFWSDEVYRIFGRGRSSGPLVSEDFFAAVHTEDRERVRAASEAAIASRQPYATEHRILRPDGTVRFVREQAEFVRAEQGRTACMVGTVQDITEQKEVEERLRQSLSALAHAKEITEQQAGDLALKNHELEQFAYIASHDLQEPLRSVSGYTQLLQRRYLNRLDADADDFIGFVVEGVGRMQRLIEGLLEYSRAARKLATETVDCEECVAASLSNLRHTLGETQGEVVRESLPRLPGDRTRLTQLFQNLIGNALKYRSEAAPRIKIEVHPEENYWHFAVLDNGIGIDPQFHERIFQMFQRLHTVQQYPGTGIGLALCKRIVDGHGGRLWVESRAGQGASFHFTLPKKELAAP